VLLVNRRKFGFTTFSIRHQIKKRKPKGKGHPTNDLSDICEIFEDFIYALPFFFQNRTVSPRRNDGLRCSILQIKSPTDMVDRSRYPLKFLLVAEAPMG